MPRSLNLSGTEVSGLERRPPGLRERRGEPGELPPAAPRSLPGRGWRAPRGSIKGASAFVHYTFLKSPEQHFAGMTACGGDRVGAVRARSGRAPGLGTVRVPLCGLQSVAKAAGGETLLRFHRKCDEVIPGEKRPSPRKSFLAPPAATIRAPSWDGCGRVGPGAFA